MRTDQGRFWISTGREPSTDRTALAFVYLIFTRAKTMNEVEARAVDRMQLVGHRVLADEPAQPDLEAPLGREVVDVAAGELADTEAFVLARVTGQEELGLVGALGARE
jgi:hypothetical protein